MRYLLTASFVTVLALARPAPAQYYPPVPPSPQFQNDQAAESLVEGWFQHFFGRAGGPGSSYWIDQVRQGQPPDHVLAQMLASQEYYDRGGRTPQGFIAKLHVDLTGQPPSPEALHYWVSRLVQGNRQEVAQALLTRSPPGWQGGVQAGYNPVEPGFGPGPYGHVYPRSFPRYRRW
jgi:hypothetical protein